MDELPDLSRQSVAEKDPLTRDLWSLVRSLTVKVTTQQTKDKELEVRLAQNSRHSSKPQPKSLCQTGERPSGGQEGASMIHEKRGKRAFDALGILSGFLGNRRNHGKA